MNDLVEIVKRTRNVTLTIPQYFIFYKKVLNYNNLVVDVCFYIKLVISLQL